jgi:hypothetical protein
MIRLIKSRLRLCGWIMVFLLNTETFAAQNIMPDTSAYPMLTVSVQAGLSSASSTCIPCTGRQAISGYTVFTSVGLLLNERLMLEAAVGSWISFNGHQNPRDSRLHLLLRTHYRPVRSGQFTVITGIGVGNFFYTPETPMHLPDGSNSLGSVTGYGPAFTTGIGHQFILSRKTILTPYADIICSLPGDLLANNSIMIPNKNASLIFTVGVNFRWMAGQ